MKLHIHIKILNYVKHIHRLNTERKYAKIGRMALSKLRNISHFPFYSHPNILQYACIAFIIRKEYFLNKIKI